MLHWEPWNNRQGERSTSTAVAPLSPLSRPFMEGVENLPQRHLCAPQSGRVGGTKTSGDGEFWALRTEAGERFGVVSPPNQ